MWAKDKGQFVSTTMRAYEQRPHYVDKYAWAVPNDAALAAIQAYNPVVEIGAGTGYWAALLQARGVSVVAYDLYPPAGDNNTFHTSRTTWTHVEKGGPEKAADHPDRALLLCWPPYNSPMAMECLNHYAGETVLYVGEWGGCTADDGFHSQLERDFDVVKTVRIPCWPGIHDTLTVHKRRR